MPATHATTAATPDRINLIDEYDARRVFLRLL
jgi:hypothetical protein